MGGGRKSVFEGEMTCVPSVFTIKLFTAFSKS